LLLAQQDLEKLTSLADLMGDVRDIADVFASISEMKNRNTVDQVLLSKIEKEFKIKYENSIKNES
jgi:hypothetical protein